MKKLMIVAAAALVASSAFAQQSDQVDVSAIIRQGLSSLSVSPDSVAFDHTPALGDAYAVSDELTLTFFAANGPWAVVATSDGLQSTNKTWVYNETTEAMEFVEANMPIKVWQASFGPAPDVGTGGTNATPAAYGGKAYPDPDDDPLFWRNPSAPDDVVWLTAFPVGPYATHLTSSKVGDVSPVKFRMGIDTFGMPAGDDYTGVVDLDLVIDPNLWD